MENRNNKRRFLAVARWLVSTALIIYLINKIDYEEFSHGIRNADIIFLGIGLFISAFSIFIRSYKWKMLLKYQGTNISLPYIYSLNFMSMFFNNFFLGSLGGDILKVFKTMDHSRTRSASVSSIIMDRITGIIVLCFVVIAAGIFMIATNRHTIIHENIYAVIVACAGMLIAIYIVDSKVDSIKKILSMRKSYPKLVAFLDNIVTSLELYRYNSQVILYSFVLSLFYLIAISVSMYCFSLSVNVHLGFTHWFFIVPLVSFIIMIPVSMNGIGLQEGTFFYYLQTVGVDPSTAVLVSIIPRFGMFVFSLIGGVLYVFDEKGNAGSGQVVP